MSGSWKVLNRQRGVCSVSCSLFEPVAGLRPARVCDRAALGPVVLLRAHPGQQGDGAVCGSVAGGQIRPKHQL